MFIWQLGFNSEGIFRVPGEKHEIDDMKKQWNKGLATPESMVGVENVAALLKLYFRELPEPLFPFSAFDSLVQFQKDYEQDSNDDEYALKLAKIIDEARRSCVCWF